jgi:hypothetical protein
MPMNFKPDMPPSFRPDDAYAASFDKDGHVLIDAELADPTVVPTIVVEFFLDDVLYRGVYHDAKDVWEIFRDRQQCYVAPRDSASYDYCEFTAQKFCDKLLAGPCPNSVRRRLSEAMLREIIDETDRDAINDFYIAKGEVPPAHLFPPPRMVTLGPPKYKISFGSSDDNAMRVSIRTVIVSSLIYVTNPSATKD